MIRIISITINACILPNRTLQLTLPNNEAAYVEADVMLHVSWNTTNVTLHPGNGMLGQSFSLHNANEAYAYIRVIQFQAEHGFSYPPPIYFEAQHKEVTTLKKLLSPLFCDHSQIAEIEMSVNHLLRECPISRPIGRSSPASIVPVSIDSRLIKVNRYLRSHIEEAITLQQLADLIHCNPVYLSNTYSQVFHISPLKHFQKMKMNRAKKLLESTTLSVKEISQRLGYISPSQFSDLFKKHYKITPMKFRRNSRLIFHDRQDKEYHTENNQ